MKMKEYGPPGGRVPGAPLDPPMARFTGSGGRLALLLSEYVEASLSSLRTACNILKTGVGSPAICRFKFTESLRKV